MAFESLHCALFCVLHRHPHDWGHFKPLHHQNMTLNLKNISFLTDLASVVARDRILFDGSILIDIFIYYVPFEMQ